MEINHANLRTRAETTPEHHPLKAPRLCSCWVVAENYKWYKGGGAAHDSYAGEIRAYADGKPEYQKLADDVEKQGKALAAPPAPGP